MTWNDVPDIIRAAIYLLAVLIPIAIWLAFRQRHRRAESGPETSQIETATIDEMPAIVEMLANDGGNRLWVMFILHQAGPTDGDQDIAVQFSVENHRVGFDWLTDNGLGKSHLGRFEDLAERRGWPVEECNYSGFHYLRVENLSPKEIAQVGKEVLSTLYNVLPNQPIEVDRDAPDWRPVAE